MNASLFHGLRIAPDWRWRQTPRSPKGICRREFSLFRRALFARARKVLQRSDFSQQLGHDLFELGGPRRVDFNRMQIDPGLVLGLQALDRPFDAADVAKFAQELFGERRGPFFGAAFVPGFLDFRDVAAKPVTGELLGIEGAHSSRIEGYGAGVSGGTR